MRKIVCLLICLSLVLSIGLMTVLADTSSDAAEPETEPTASVTPDESPASSKTPDPAETDDPSESPVPSETTTPSKSPAPSETVVPTPEPKAIFEDVPATGKYYSEPVRFVAENGYMAGVSATKFAPDKTVTRGMVTTILYAMDGKPSVTAPNKFRDVAAGKWYTTSVIWANYYGIVAGYEDGTFRPERPVTRQEFAAILYKYSSVTKKNTAATGNIDVFSDKSTIAKYAVTPMKWAVGHELLSGMGKNILLPKGNATRAQLATIIKAYVTKLDNGQHTAPVYVPVSTPKPSPSVKPTPAPVTPIKPTNTSSNTGTRTNVTNNIPASTNATTTYVLNTNTKKFHYSSCGEVSKIKASNKKVVTASRASIISQGFQPCKKCNP